MGSDRKIGTYDFKVLHEQIADNDLFEDKTHERLAISLDRLIRNEDQGITIGLEGSWGSGKSTVISLLKKNLAVSDSKKTLFFMFDAWAHDGDPLRKIFLERLIDTVDPNGNNKFLSSLKLTVSSRKKTVEVKTHKRASKLGKWLSIWTLLVPFGVALLSAQNYEKISMPWSTGATDAHWYFIVGIIAVLAPALFAIYWGVWGGRKEGNNKWDFFESSGTENYIQDVTEDGERTSIEFERFFSLIMSHLIDEQKKYDKAIIVIDNLDRVDPAHAKNIWATLQTFFQHRSTPSSSSKGTWVNKLWFIVPFDREGLSRIWESNGRPLDNELNDDSEVASSFFNKCFQVISYVPKPVPSGWVNYLNTRIKDALIGWPETEKEKVLEVIQGYIARTGETPTPRKIQLLINQIGYLGLQWGGSVSSEAICLYSLYRQKYSENILKQELLSYKLPEKMQTQGDADDIKAEIAGLLFGVEKNKGVQLLLGPEIEQALRIGNPTEVTKILALHQCAFWVAWEANINSWLPTTSHTEDYRIAFTNAITLGLEDHIDKVSKVMTSLARTWCDTKDKWELDKNDYSLTLKNLIDKSPSTLELIDSIKSTARSRIFTIINSENLEQPEDDTLINIGRLLELLRGLGQPLQRQTHSKLQTKRWQKWLDLLDENETLITEMLPPSGTIGWLVDSCQFDQVSPNEGQLDYLIRTFSIYQSSNEWNEQREKILAWLSIPSRNPNCSNYYDFILLLVQAQAKITIPLIIAACKTQEFWQPCSSAEGGTLSYLSILAAMTFEGKIQSSKQVVQTVKDIWKFDATENMVSWFYNTLRSCGQLHILWLLARDEENKFAIKIIRNNEDVEIYSLSEATNYIDEYSWLSQDELCDYAQKLCLQGSFENNKPEMTGDSLTYHTVFRIFYDHGDDSAREFIRAEMNNASEDDWVAHLKKASSLLGCIDSKNLNFSRALSKYLSSIVVGEEKSSKEAFWNSIESLFEYALDVETTLLPKLASSYFNSESDFLDDYQFKKFSSLIEHHIENIDPKRYMAKLTQWIEANKNERVVWFSRCRFTETQAPLEELSEVVRNKFSSYDGELQQIIRELSEKIGLSLLDVSEESESETQQQ